MLILSTYSLFEQIIVIRDIIRPATRENFNDVYIVYELMDTDLHQIIRSSQVLTEDHCQVCLYSTFGVGSQSSGRTFNFKWLIASWSEEWLL